MIKIYSTPTCHYCKVAKKFLTDNNIAYEEINIMGDAKMQQHIREKTGKLGVPVIEINNEFIMGFDEHLLCSKLGI